MPGGGVPLQSAPPVERPIGRLGLFLRIDDENAYVHSMWPEITARLRLLGLGGSGVFVLASIVDWTKLHGTAAFWGVLAARLVVLALGLNLWRIARQDTPRPAALRSALIAFELCGIVAFRMVNLAYGDYSPNMGMSGLLMVLAIYAYVPLLSPVNFWLLPAATASLFVLSAGWFGASLRDLSALLVMSVFVHLLGWSAAARSARNGRLAWLDRRRLEHEIDERRVVESNLRHLFEVCPVPLVLSQQHTGLALRFNRAAKELLDPQNRYPEPGLAHALHFYANLQDGKLVAKSLRERGVAGPIDLRMKTAEGVGIQVMLDARLLRYDGKPAVLTSLVEITERKQREHDLTRMTQTDMLTGTYNRRGFFERAESMLRESRHGLPCLLLIDADHFKRVNDTHGHQVGDVVLLQLANRMSSMLREGDLMGRIGGEEFAILLPQSSVQAAIAMAERIREAVARHALRIQGLRVPMTLSIGVAAVLPGEGTLSAALGRADTAMYNAKQGGRNRVQVASTSTSAP
jgi:diguanylate cyclase (GGDEF)-like protein